MEITISLEKSHQITYCPNREDYSPCVCDHPRWIKCHNISLATMSTVFDETIQKRISNELEQVRLVIPKNDLTIPANLLHNYRVMNWILLQCEGITEQRLTININAFRSSRNFTRSIAINNCNVTGLNFHFLQDFILLNMLCGARSGVVASASAPRSMTNVI